MDTISDDDLVLYHYRDGLDANRLAAIDAALRASTALRDRYASIERALTAADALPTPSPDADFNARLWRRLEPALIAQAASPRSTHAVRAERMRPSWLDRLHAWLTPPRIAFAACACVIALAIGIGFYAGRRSATDATALAQSQPDATSARVLDAYVAAHLRATEGVLLTASNSDSTELLDGNRQLAAALVESNRLYALAATRAGNVRLADFLRQLEPVLISLANPAATSTVKPSEGLRDYLRATDLMFQVRATEAGLDRGGAHRT